MQSKKKQKQTCKAISELFYPLFPRMLQRYVYVWKVSPMVKINSTQDNGFYFLPP